MGATWSGLEMYGDHIHAAFMCMRNTLQILALLIQFTDNRVKQNMQIANTNAYVAIFLHGTEVEADGVVVIQNFTVRMLSNKVIYIP